MYQRFTIFIILIQFAAAEDTITLYFKDFWQGKPLEGVTIKVGNYHYLTDQSGRAIIPLPNNADEKIEINKDNYFPLIVSLQELRDQQEVYMQSIEKSDEVDIIDARLQTGQREIPGSYRFMKLKPYDRLYGDGLAHMLERLPGIFIKDYGGSAGLKTVSIRGSSAEHTLLAYDGIPLTNPQLGMNDLSILPFLSANALEIYRGGNSLLFGSGAVGGALNFIPQEPDSQMRFQVNVVNGSWGNQTYATDIHMPMGVFYQNFGLSYHASQNDYSYSYNGHTRDRTNNDASGYDIYYRLMTKNSGLLMELFYNTLEKGMPKSPVLNEGRARQNSSQLFSRIKWQPGTNWAIQIYHQQQTLQYNDPDVLINQTGLYSRHRFYITGVTGQTVFNPSHTCVLHLRADAEHSSINSTDAGKHGRQRMALAAVLNQNLYHSDHRTLTLYPSLRVDYYSDVGITTSPKVGINFVDRLYQIFLSFGRNFRVPTYNELYWQPGGNTALEPEYALSWEGGIRNKFNGLGRWQTEVTCYQNHIQDMIRWMPTGIGDIWQPINISVVRSRGVEFDITYSPYSKLQLSANYNLNEIKKIRADFTGDQTVGNQLPHLPQELFNFIFSWQEDNWDFYIRSHRTSFRYTTFENQATAILPSYWLLDGWITYHRMVWSRKWIIFLAVYNISDELYQAMEGFPMQGRTFSLGLTLNIIK
jgi:vitamin B12 transporter